MRNFSCEICKLQEPVCESVRPTISQPQAIWDWGVTSLKAVFGDATLGQLAFHVLILSAADCPLWEGANQDKEAYCGILQNEVWFSILDDSVVAFWGEDNKMKTFCWDPRICRFDRPLWTGVAFDNDELFTRPYLHVIAPTIDLHVAFLPPGVNLLYVYHYDGFTHRPMLVCYTVFWHKYPYSSWAEVEWTSQFTWSVYHPSSLHYWRVL